MYTSAYDCTDIGTFTHLDAGNLLETVHQTDPIITVLHEYEIKQNRPSYEQDIAGFLLP